METIKNLIDLFLHVDKNLVVLIQNYGIASYAILFGIIFMETGLVIMPFLPGDSLLFAAGALSAIGSFNIWGLFGLLLLAAFLGDTVNYWIGHFIGPRAFASNFQFSIFNFKINLNKILKKEYLEKATEFYEKHGGKAIVLARFVPIVRTFAPFVAGIGKMNYGQFLTYNLLGGFAWVALFTFGGFFFGNLTIIKENFHYAVVFIILISLVPIAYEWVKARRSALVSKYKLK